ncbi:unnamed protein product [Boreogadus saida]
MKIPRRKLLLFIVFAYVGFSFYAAYNVFFGSKVISRVHRVVKKITVGPPGGAVAPFIEDEEWNPWEDEEVEYNSALNRKREAFQKHLAQINKNKPKRYKVQIWGKAAIGLYLWEHILDGPLHPTDKVAQWREGELQSGKIDFSFYTGPAVVQGHVPLDMNSLVLVLNGREQQKISYSTRWLEHVHALVQARTVSHVAVVLLGNEHCVNDWISPYLKRNGGFVELLFVVYDSPWVNNIDVFQWPLGVATYRQFPIIRPSLQMVTSIRPYLCNFQGTVYKNSSREILVQVLKQADIEKDCITTARDNRDGDGSAHPLFWAPAHTEATQVLMLGLFMYSCWRRHKGLEEGVYHVSAHHGEWEDIRENVLNYDEEGGGEQDQNAFNMVELQRSLQPSPAQSLRYSYPQCIISYPQTKPSPDGGSRSAMPNGSGSAAIALRLAVPPSETQALPSPLTFRRSGHSLSFSSQDLARYLCEVIRDMEQPGGAAASGGGGDNHVAGAMTTPRRKDRGLVSVRSLSSLSDGQGAAEEEEEEGSSEGGASAGARGGAKPQQSLGKQDRFKTLRAVVGELRGGAAEGPGRCRSPGGPKEKQRESRAQPNCEKSG